MTTKTKTFTPEEVASVLRQLDNGAELARLAEEHECRPSDIWRLWDQRNQGKA